MQMFGDADPPLDLPFEEWPIRYDVGDLFSLFGIEVELILHDPFRFHLLAYAGTPEMETIRMQACALNEWRCKPPQALVQKRFRDLDLGKLDKHGEIAATKAAMLSVWTAWADRHQYLRGKLVAIPLPCELPPPSPQVRRRTAREGVKWCRDRTKENEHGKRWAVVQLKVMDVWLFRDKADAALFKMTFT
ncbi:hypothetical protein [Teichococcus vastitatis]|uniref:hypothetical protein n=1 Tax=Teichococcus vastitatis TaxID=2307076 RepID=UPI000E73FCFB|nr:hypothetical protein [Pseudoroseomonas vastitatis]